MVSVTIYVEGGVLPNSNVDAATINNSQRLRESFTKLFRKVLAEEHFDLKIEMSAGELNAAKFFKEDIEKGNEAVLLIDVYPHKTKPEKLKDFDLEKSANFVFFMVREMEAWILSQPLVLEEFASNENLVRVNQKQAIADDKSIKGKDIQKIHQPSDVLETILGRFFEKRNGKKQKYGKLKDAPTMLELLNIHELRKTFEDVENLIQHIETKKN